MDQARVLRFYLDPDLRNSAAEGKHNFIGKIASVAVSGGFRVEYLDNTAVERALAPTRDGFAMFHMEEPTHDRALTIRRVYHYPFWQIESSGQRWEWDVAKADFFKAEIDRKEASRFYRYWQKRLFPEVGKIGREGVVYVPLQGRLLEKRSFQTKSPIDMIKAVLAHDPHRMVVATLHPNEVYLPDEMKALEVLEAKNPRLEIQIGRMDEWLCVCDYIVTENSSAAFNGYFFGKPALLFAKVDFHHIAVQAGDNLADDFRAVQSLTPDYEGYVWWFWQVMSINAGRPEAEDKIRQVLQRHGWLL